MPENKMQEDYPSLYIGPMSLNVVDSVIECANELDNKIGLIPSRRQIEYNGGYVNNWKTADFAAHVRSKSDLITIQRDHGGRLQGAHSEIISYNSDILGGKFDLVHIDPWKKFVSLGEMVKATANDIRICDEAGQSAYEVGTEEAIHRYTSEELDQFLTKLARELGPLFEKVKYAVIQSGTAIVGTKNVGSFDSDRCKRMIKVCGKHGLMSKEHNGDYLTLDQVALRYSLGLDAINIAPEFGVAETKYILEKLVDQPELKERLFQICYDSDKWKKWVSKDFLLTNDTKEDIIIVSGHYVFASPEFESIKKELGEIDSEIKHMLKNKIRSLLDCRKR
jgi:hypothetical protein